MPPGEYGERVPKKNTFSSWSGRLVQRAVHAGWAWLQRTGSVTAERPGRFRFGAMGTGTRLAFPLGTVFGEPWIHLGSHCIIGEQVTLTAGLMPDLDLGAEPILRIGDGVVLGRGSHVIADTTVTIGSDCYFGPYVYVTAGVSAGPRTDGYSCGGVRVTVTGDQLGGRHRDDDAGLGQGLGREAATLSASAESGPARSRPGCRPARRPSATGARGRSR